MPSGSQTSCMQQKLVKLSYYIKVMIRVVRSTNRSHEPTDSRCYDQFLIISSAVVFVDSGNKMFRVCSGLYEFSVVFVLEACRVHQFLICEFTGYVSCVFLCVCVCVFVCVCMDLKVSHCGV